MPLYDAKVADVVRCYQRDELFIEHLQNDVYSILQTAGIRSYNRLRKVVPAVSTAWYYFLTSLNNVQTLGEEYAGILRLSRSEKIPSKFVQILWLVLYVGGESLYDRFLEHISKKTRTSDLLRNSAKEDILKYTQFLKNNKQIILRLHYSLFYVDACYYNIANRISGIRYVLLRQWLQDESSTKSFKILGKISLAYLLFALIQKGIASENVSVSPTVLDFPSARRKTCALCAESRKNTCATFCGHLFCWDCIHDNLSYQQSCPICREIISPSRIIYLQNYI